MVWGIVICAIIIVCLSIYLVNLKNEIKKNEADLTRLRKNNISAALDKNSQVTELQKLNDSLMIKETELQKLSEKLSEKEIELDKVKRNYMQYACGFDEINRQAKTDIKKLNDKIFALEQELNRKNAETEKLNKKDIVDWEFDESFVNNSNEKDYDKFIWWYGAESSHVKRISHDHGKSILYVEFKDGTIYSYENVNNDLFNKFLKAKSLGKFLRSEIIPFHKSKCERKTEGVVYKSQKFESTSQSIKEEKAHEVNNDVGDTKHSCKLDEIFAESSNNITEKSYAINSIEVGTKNNCETEKNDGKIFETTILKNNKSSKINNRKSRDSNLRRFTIVVEQDGEDKKYIDKKLMGLKLPKQTADLIEEVDIEYLSDITQYNSIFTIAWNEMVKKFDRSKTYIKTAKSLTCNKGAYAYTRRKYGGKEYNGIQVYEKKSISDGTVTKEFLLKTTVLTKKELFDFYSGKYEKFNFDEKKEQYKELLCEVDKISNLPSQRDQKLDLLERMSSIRKEVVYAKNKERHLKLFLTLLGLSEKDGKE